MEKLIDMAIVSNIILVLILPYLIPLGFVIYSTWRKNKRWGYSCSYGRDDYGWTFTNGFYFHAHDMMDVEYSVNLPSEVRTFFLENPYTWSEFSVFLMDYAHMFEVIDSDECTRTRQISI